MIWHNVRLMNGLTSFLVLTAFAMLIASGVYAVIHLPEFTLRTVIVEAPANGTLHHITQAEVSAHINGKFSRNFFTVDLDEIKHAFMAVPWVRHVSVRRQWPNSVIVVVEEHVPFAVWGAPATLRLLNPYGEVFRINRVDFAKLGKDKLIAMTGPDGSAVEMVARYGRLEKIFSPLGWRLATLNLSQRYAWMAQFDNGFRLELGREEGESHEDNKLSLEERAQRFVAVWPKLAERFTQIAYADLRYTNGFALQASTMRGAGTKLQAVN